MSLRVLDRLDAFRTALNAERRAGRSIGLVPTMGFLHAGHTALMRRAAADCDIVVATVFVNPLQFAPNEDLEGYPRDLDGDQRLAAEAGVDYFFAPPNAEMFPEPPLTSVHVGGISERLDGAFRPTHFTGVATIVAKLLALAGPCRAYFGEKDYQQLTIIRRLTADLSLPVEIIGCPTVRDADGLALSSRNAYLTPAERAVAPALYRALLAGRAAIGEQAVSDPATVRSVMVETVQRHPELALDYAEVADPADLSPVTKIAGDVRLLIAARVGRARLIDNIGVTWPA